MVCVCVHQWPGECGDMGGLVNGGLKNGTLPHILMDYKFGGPVCLGNEM